ncbi:AAA domain-containing protein [Dinghuibacter silviterrae]|uniref:Putative DNA helicase n=1 Tax=Dinghuibacter silviterrae TaxID=1539049 RepID=A0A4R8DF38_9BACT|nr:AAA domain-containing protein [Dinghuibacter silviterrae]TDW96065.1 putative DNA helicase [Dinghuibacter silviterrae]
MDYFKALQELLLMERTEDKAAYMALVRSSSVSDRRAAGLAWYPVAIRGSEPGRGDYLILEVERTTHRDIPHQLRFGVSALFFSNHNPEEHHVEGVISYLGGDRLKITLKEEELPDWASDGKLGIDLLFDDNSYDEMLQALRRAAALVEDSRKGRLVRVLTGAEEALWDEAAHGAHGAAAAGPRPGASGAQPAAAAGLNPSQQAAVQQILSAQDLAIVHGPPGTGKTTTLVHAIKALLERDAQKILVTAPSNTAVDLLSERLSEAGISVLRLGNPARVSERLGALTLDSRMATHPSVRDIRQLKRRAVEFRDMAHKYKRQFGKAERDQRKALLDEARKIMKDVENMERYILEDLMAKTQVVAATLVGAAHYMIRDLHFGTAVIDEAGQALEPGCWIPALKADRLVLAGDHLQLPPVIKSEEAARRGLGETLMEKCVARHPQAVTLLEEQYRMHEVIMGYSSRVFYENRVRAHPLVAGRLLPGQSPLAFIDTAGCGFEERQEGNALGNPEEAAFLFKHLSRLAGELDPAAFPSIAVISPYRLQVQLLKEQLDHSPDLTPFAAYITINTIDGFQGQEKDVVYISLTRSNTDNRIGFLSEIRRMNVAMTRARKRLVVIGDSATLSQTPFYAEFIEYAQTQGEYRSAWEFME